MGMTHGEPDTFPRTGDVIGFCTPGPGGGCRRKDRHHPARLGQSLRSQARAAEIHHRDASAWRNSARNWSAAWATALSPPRDFRLHRSGDRLGWMEGDDGTGISLCSSRTAACATAERMLLSGLHAIAETARRPLHPDAEPEPDDRRRRTGPEGADRRAAAAHGLDSTGRAAAPQCHGLRRVADLRAGAGRERTLPARPDHRAGRRNWNASACATTRSSSA